MARLRARPRRVRADASRGDGTRRPGHASRSDLGAFRPRRVPRRRHRLRGVRAARRYSTQGVGHPLHDRREERRSRGDLVSEHVSGRTGGRRKSLLLLQLRTDRPVDSLLRRATRAAGLFSTRAGQVRRRTTRAVGDRGHRRHVGRRHGDVDRAHPRGRRQHVLARGPGRHQRRRTAGPPSPARHCGTRSVCPAAPFTPRSGTTQSTYAASAWR